MANPTFMRNRYVILPFLLLLNLVLVGQISSLPTWEILMSTFRFKYGSVTGTCFGIDVDKDEYLITAKHLIKDSVKSGDLVQFEIEIANEYKKFQGRVFLHTNPIVDVAVIKLSERIGTSTKYSNEGAFLLGQDCYFLGFPLTPGFGTLTLKFKLPLVKKAAIASTEFIFQRTSIILLDGQNNHGFSGGPVIFHDYKAKRNVILGVVSGYFSENNKALIEFKKDTLTTEIAENSGIIACYHASYFLEIIKANKIN